MKVSLKRVGFTLIVFMIARISVDMLVAQFNLSVFMVMLEAILMAQIYCIYGRGNKK